ncbi:hypothetical protein [Archaeoglobus neptunius]|uniref:hypothetical protein n=1 Tax=Archaeoglobus neptunius TaxID=2798580 RepID=UPI0019281EF7|nr:hypothetical protein [Archaeoglobus neptunius]
MIGIIVFVNSNERKKEEIRKINAKLREEFGDEAAWMISVNPRTGEKSVDVFVHSMPANQKLNTTIDGWRVMSTAPAGEGNEVIF